MNYIRKIGDWTLSNVELGGDDNYKYANIIFRNSCDEEVGIMFWKDCGDSINFAFCSRYDELTGVMAMDYDDLQLFILLAKRIKTYDEAIKYGKAHGFLKED